MLVVCCGISLTFLLLYTSTTCCMYINIVDVKLHNDHFSLEARTMFKYPVCLLVSESVLSLTCRIFAILKFITSKIVMNSIN